MRRRWRLSMDVENDEDEAPVDPNLAKNVCRTCLRQRSSPDDHRKWRVKAFLSHRLSRARRAGRVTMDKHARGEIVASFRFET